MPSPRRLRDVSNTNFGILNRLKDNHLISYKADKITLSSKDTILSSDKVLDGDLPDDFVDQIGRTDPNNLSFDGVDGGGFH